MKLNKTTLIWFIIYFVPLVFTGCHQYDNFTTYFNTYYNAHRLIKEAEDEFEFHDIGKKVNPRVFVPEPQIKFPGLPQTGAPPFLQEFIIDEAKLKPVEVKLDSIEIKGSKILARHPKSDYIEGVLYLMALSYFYQSSWLPSQVKCSELIDKFPDGDLSPDAHLLFSENLLIQRKFHAGKIMLSRTVDIAWQKKRYDILAQAFRFQADLAIYEKDFNGALQPYKQAIAQSDDDEIRAKWQIDMSALLYRMGRFKEAERGFAKANSYSPDYIGTFESYLYQSQCLMRLGKFTEAEEILEKLEGDGKFEEWQSYVFAAKMNMYRMQKKDKEFAAAEKYADSAYMNNPALLAVYYEKAMDSFTGHDYNNARKYFSRASQVRTPIKETAQQMFFLLNSWSQKLTELSNNKKKLELSPQNDSLKTQIARILFESGRIQEQLGNKDSAEVCFRTSLDYSPASDTNTARYLYAYSRVLQDSNPQKSDSLLEKLVLKYPSTAYGKEAIVKQGYTNKFVIDTVAELYYSGSSLRANKEYSFAIAQFTKLYTTYPKSSYAPKAIYSIGWTFEKNLKNYDSAMYYYNIILKDFPKSDYAADIRISVDYLAALKSGQPIPDSLQKHAYVPRRKYDPVRGPETGLIQPPDPGRPPKGKLDPMDIIKHPGKVLDGTLDGIKEVWKDTKDSFNKMKDDVKDNVANPEKLIPKMNLPADANKFLKQDSTSKKLPVQQDTTKKTVDVIEPKK